MTVPDIRVPAIGRKATMPVSVQNRAKELGLHRLLLPLDGSDESEQTLPFAALIAHRVESELSLFHCLQPMHPVRVGKIGHIPYPDAQHDRGSHLATSYLQEVKARLKPHGLHSRWNVATGSAAHLIAYRAVTGKFGLTMVAARSKPRVVTEIQPNITADLWKLTASPLFLINTTYVRLNGEGAACPETIFIPLIEPEAFEAALPLATSLAMLLEARLVILINNRGEGESDPAKALEIMAPTRTTANNVADELSGQGCETDVEDVTEGLLGIARRQVQERGSWVVAGSHMRSGFSNILRRGKGDSFLRQCRGPLIVVPTETVAKSREKRIRKKVASAESAVSIG